MKYIKIYADFLKKFLKPERELKVVFDCSNGTTGPILKRLKIKDLRFKIINDKPDGNFPAHGPNPLAKNATGQLKRAVLKNKADLGVIFDGDGDRARFVDDKGRDINPDIIAILMIWRLNAKKIVIDALTGWTVKNLKNENRKIKFIASKVGRQSISDNMKRQKADLGIEYSGHYYFKKFNRNDSGILAAIEIINALSLIPFLMSQFINLNGDFFRETRAIKNKKINPRKIENFYKKSAKKISHLDGLTMEFASPVGKWWFNLRPSNTEPLVRLNIEAESQKILKAKEKELINLLKKI